MKFLGKKQTGFTETTAQTLLLGAGVFYKNYVVESDTHAKAVEDGRCLGATRGGGEFKATPTIRPIEVDGLNTNTKDNKVIDEWVVTLMANVLELTKENIILALVAAGIDEEKSNAKYNAIVGRGYIEPTDYVDNVTFVGRLSGSNDPVVVQVFNALNTNGLTLQGQNNNEATMQLIFTANYGLDDLDTPPFVIYHPKQIGAPAEPTPEEKP